MTETIIEKVPRAIIEDAAKNMGWRDGDWREDYDPMKDPIEPYLQRLENMTPKKIFECYCNWHGLINWGPQLWGIVMDLHDAAADGES